MNTKSLEEKLEKISEKITQIEVTMERNTGSLEKHMLRTDLSEKRLEHMEEALKPITKHVNHVEGALKLLGALATLTGVVTGIVKLFF
jgi:chromosome segregation ATPase